MILTHGETYSVTYLLFCIALYLINLICVVSEIHIFAMKDDILYNLEHGQNKSISETILQYPVNYIRGTPSREFDTAYQLQNSPDDNSSLKQQHVCADIQHQNDAPNKHTLDFSNIFDTISYDDVVRNQYFTLPYAVRKDRFNDERRHYVDRGRNTPYLVAQTIVLENLNHFLFNGRNNFM